MTIAIRMLSTITITNLSGNTEWIGWVGEDTAMSSWGPTSPDTALSLFIYLDHQNDKLDHQNYNLDH